MMNTFNRYIGEIHTGEPMKIGGIWLVPLFSGLEGPEADLLDEGISKGITRVSEVDDWGEVGEILVEHRGSKRLLIIDGEQITGGKQDRIFNSSFIVEPGSRTRIPVSCVERGRWRVCKSEKFTSSVTTLSASARANKLKSVTNSLFSRKLYESDQYEVWDSVEKVSGKRGVRSPTESYTDVFMGAREEIEEKIEDIKPMKDQVGIMVIHNGTFVSMDLFGSPSLFSRSFKKVIRGLLVDEFDQRDICDDPKNKTIMDSLEVFKNMSMSCNRAPGSGETIYGSTDKLVVTGICDRGVLYHAYAANAG